MGPLGTNTSFTSVILTEFSDIRRNVLSLVQRKITLWLITVAATRAITSLLKYYMEIAEDHSRLYGSTRSLGLPFWNETTLDWTIPDCEVVTGRLPETESFDTPTPLPCPCRKHLDKPRWVLTTKPPYKCPGQKTKKKGYFPTNPKDFFARHTQFTLLYVFLQNMWTKIINILYLYEKFPLNTNCWVKERIL